MEEDVDENGTVPERNRAVAERAERLRQAVRESGGNTAVAKRAGMHIGTLNNYLGGRDMKAEALVSLASATGVRLEWLARGTGPMHSSESGLFETGTEMAGDDLISPTPGTVRISRYDTRAAAGGGATMEGAIIGSIEFMEDWLRRSIRRDPRSLALLECWGDSMEPTIKDGDILMIDTAARDVLSGRIYVLQVDGELRVKRVEKRIAGPVLVVSDNDRYPVEELSADQVERLRVVGEVVWFGRLARRA